MKIQKNDFIELEFTGISNDMVFDTTNPKEAEEMGLKSDVEIKPIIACVGNKMILQGLDDELEGKEIGKQYSVHLTPDKAFGPRNSDMVKTVSMKIFKEKNMNPMPGMTLQLDNYIAKILSVSGGRVIVDFNNPLAGKEVDYKFKILRKVEDINEKVNALQDFFFRKRFEFKADKEKKKIIFSDEKIKPIIEMFKQKFEDMIGFKFEVSEEKEEKEKQKKEGKKKKEEKRKEEKKEEKKKK